MFDLCLRTRPVPMVPQSNFLLRHAQVRLGVHSLTNVDRETRTADCAVCGPQIQISVRVHNKPDRKTPYEISCMTKRREDPRRQTRRQKKLHEKYKMTEADYDRMYSQQQGVCPICLTEYPRLVVDHDHRSGRVRALLCAKCNRGIGFLQDAAEVAERAAQYLRDHQIAEAS